MHLSGGDFVCKPSRHIPGALAGSWKRETSDMLSLVLTMSGSTLMKGLMPIGGFTEPPLLFDPELEPAKGICVAAMQILASGMLTELSK